MEAAGGARKTRTAQRRGEWQAHASCGTLLCPWPPPGCAPSPPHRRSAGRQRPARWWPCRCPAARTGGAEPGCLRGGSAAGAARWVTGLRAQRAGRRSVPISPARTPPCLQCPLPAPATCRLATLTHTHDGFHQVHAGPQQAAAQLRARGQPALAAAALAGGRRSSSWACGGGLASSWGRQAALLCLSRGRALTCGPPAPARAAAAHSLPPLPCRHRCSGRSAHSCRRAGPASCAPLWAGASAQAVGQRAVAAARGGGGRLAQRLSARLMQAAQAPGCHQAAQPGASAPPPPHAAPPRPLACCGGHWMPALTAIQESRAESNKRKRRARRADWAGCRQRFIDAPSPTCCGGSAQTQAQVRDAALQPQLPAGVRSPQTLR